MYDTLVIGPLSLDQNIDYQNNHLDEVGGAVEKSGWASARVGARTAIFTKCNPSDCTPEAVFDGSGADVFWKPSKQTTSIRNQYFTADKETRDCRALGQCDEITFDELPAIETQLYHFAGLIYGDFSGETIRKAHQKGKVAVDVQCLLRHANADGTMTFFDWAEKETYLPDIDFLKTDAAEAKILTGTDDRRAAARQLHAWGAREVVISHNTELLAYDGETFFTSPIVARNLSGRTGRGDTAFAGYITERLHADIPTALQFAAALVSLKMETPGPFKGTREDVMAYMREFYPA